MTDNSSLDRVQRIQREAIANKAEAEILAETFDDSTGASWLWAFLFGPLYFAVHGFWGRAAIVLVLSFFIIGIFVAPFLAYPAWRERAKKKAENMLMLDSVRRG
ncbi:DUF2628 domain-containing protein [Antarctobacter sp.]|uniref:DUF2628 domain-containing protein n=1 Tax=Antarctobacter sp. TaxID=1872577 RepID=UPI002B2673B6|nr:DUF2628 domain-containing protein [Antarctobacter sp.]